MFLGGGGVSYERGIPVLRFRQEIGIGVVGVGVLCQSLDRNVQRFPGGLVFKAHKLRASLNSRRESNKEEDEGPLPSWRRSKEVSVDSAIKTSFVSTSVCLAVLNLRTTTSQKCESVPSRARI